jgi:hypothetical protein
MKRVLALVVLAFALSGCAGTRYSMDMSGLDRLSNDTSGRAADKYTMSELNRLSDATLGEAGDKYSMSKLNDLSSETFDPYTRGR